MASALINVPPKARRGDIIEIHPAHEERIIRLELFGDEVERISVVMAFGRSRK